MDSFLIVGLFLVVVFGIVFWSNKKNKEGMAAKMPLLAQVIQGQVLGDRIQGAFQSVPVSGRVHGVQTDEESFAKSYFWVIEVQVAGMPEFDLARTKQGQFWVQTADQNLRARLEAGGLIQVATQIPAVGAGKGALFGRGGMLQLMVPMRNQAGVPTPEEFQQQLQILMQLGGICHRAVAG